MTRTHGALLGEREELHNGKLGAQLAPRQIALDPPPPPPKENDPPPALPPFVNP